MLVISRMTDEYVVLEVPPDLGTQVILVSLVNIYSSKKVRLGFEMEAPIKCHRLEVYRRILSEGQGKDSKGAVLPSVRYPPADCSVVRELQRILRQSI